MLLWNQHNVGDAGFRGENRYQAFYSTDWHSPAYYVPVVHGTPPSDALSEIWHTFVRKEGTRAAAVGAVAWIEPAEGWKIDADHNLIRKR